MFLYMEILKFDKDQRCSLMTVSEIKYDGLIKKYIIKTK